MALSIIQHGFWVLSDTPPEGSASWAAYAHRESDGIDWYEFLRADPNELQADSLKMTVMQNNDHHWIIQTVNSDATRLFPASSLLIEVDRFDGDDPQDYFGQREFFPVTNTFGEIASPPLPPLSRRQFFQIGAMMGLITPDEALAAVQHGTIPAKIQAYIDGIGDPQQKFAVQMLIAGAGEFDRHHPMTEGLAVYLGINSQQLDEMWRQGAQL